LFIHRLRTGYQIPTKEPKKTKTKTLKLAKTKTFESANGVCGGGD